MCVGLRKCSGMKSELNLSEIKNFWQRRADKFGTATAASWADSPMVELEVKNIARYLKLGDRVLDVGCANGHTAMALAKTLDISVHGVDYIEGMIVSANQALQQHNDLDGRVSFACADVLASLNNLDGFDVAYTVRVLINLETIENQKKAIRNICQTVRPGGKVLFSEATVNGWVKLNKFRAEWGLSGIPIKPFNLYIEEEMVFECLPDECTLELIEPFSSSYYVGTRVFKPLLAACNGIDIDVSNAEMEFNKFFAACPPIGDYAVQKLFVVSREA